MGGGNEGWEQHHRLKEARGKAGFTSARKAAARFNWAPSTYGAHENGTRKFGTEEAAVYARAFRVNPLWIEHGIEGEHRALPIMGYIGAGAQIEPEFEQVPPEGLDQVELLIAIPSDLIGLQVRGDSMLPRYEDGDVIVVWRDQHGPIDALIGREAAVRTTKGQRYLKRLRRGQRGAYNLESTNAGAKLIESVRLDWASEIYLIVPARQLRRVAPQRERAGIRTGT